MGREMQSSQLNGHSDLPIVQSGHKEAVTPGPAHRIQWSPGPEGGAKLSAPEQGWHAVWVTANRTAVWN